MGINDMIEGRKYGRKANKVIGWIATGMISTGRGLLCLLRNWYLALPVDLWYN